MTGIDRHFLWQHLLAILILLAMLAPVRAGDTAISLSTLSLSLQEQLATGDSLPIKPVPDWLQLRQVYRNYDYQLLWHTLSGELSAAGSALKRYISRSTTLGLVPGLYHAHNLDTPDADPVRRVARNDLLLTDGFLRLARHLAEGQLDPSEVDPLWKIAVERIENSQLLDQAVIGLNPVAVLQSLDPENRGYRRLLEALAHYRRLADRGGWSPLPETPLIRPGERHDLIPLLRQRLRASEELEPGALPDDAREYDPRLQRSVEQFQQSHGLKQDGIIGPQTRAALNVPVEQRVA